MLKYKLNMEEHLYFYQQCKIILNVYNILWQKEQILEYLTKMEILHFI